MGREVRRVPKSWKHPKNSGDNYIPLFEGPYAAAVESAKKYDEDPPNPVDYMPDWSDDERTHYQMYEDTSEGTPVSPVLESPDLLARWLVDNGASAFADQTATYESWLRVASGGFAPSMIFSTASGLQNGVDAMTEAFNINKKTTP